MLETEFPFMLPLGFIDGDGNRHREGTMRLATAYDEIAPMKDPRVQSNPGYLGVILLSRVVTRLGEVVPINPRVIESLFAADFAYLQDMYVQANTKGHTRLSVSCPHCEKNFEVETEQVGE